MPLTMTGSKRKILLVDDEASNLEILRRILAPGSKTDSGSTQEPIHSNYMLCVAKSGQATLKKAIEEKPDLILLDVIMPDMSGFEVLSALKQSDATRNIPVIFITGMDSVEDEEKGFLLGAVDYIRKPFHSALVRARVKTHLQIAEQMRTIEMIGLMDTLTNIPNRRGFDNQIANEWKRAMRKKRPLSLLMIDIDNFKKFNDTYGHQQGDVVLQTVADILETSLKRTGDFAARWGGEEFAVILPDTDIGGAAEIAESIRKNIEATVVPCIKKTFTISVTVSIGAASILPESDSIIHKFTEQADKALYNAKKEGRNRVCIFQE